MSDRKEARDLYIKEYSVKIGGVSHKLRYDLAAFAALEDAGYSYEEIVTMATKISFKGLAVLLWAGTRHEGDDSLTIEAISHMVDMNGFIAANRTVATDILNTLPVKDEDEDEDKTPKNPKAQETKPQG